MINKSMLAILLAATALTMTAPATAKSKPMMAHTNAAPVLPAEIIQMLREQQAQIQALAAEVATLKSNAAAPVVAPVADEEATAQNEFLAAQVDALQAQVSNLKLVTAANTPVFKATPEVTGQAGTPNEGYKFKVRGRFMYDTAFTSNPNNLIPTKDLGFASRIRRIRIGVEGGLPGGFGYKAEVDYANAAVGFGDVVFSYRPKHDGVESPIELVVGNFETLDGLEQISSSRFISFLERSQFNEAFANGRKLGVSAAYISPDNAFRFTVGAFNDTINADRGFNNDYVLAARTTYFTPAFGGQLHFGANVQYRKYQTAPTTGATNGLASNYQARPFTQNTDTRFVATGNLALRSDTIIGAEFIGLFGPLHVTAEGQYLKARTIRPTDVLTSGDVTNGTRTNANPSFWGGYAEIGYWLTGETRGYKNGLWDRTKVANPINKGGSGAWQINARYDYIDLSSESGVSGFGSAPNFVNGGKQTGYLGSLVWQPIDYVRFTAQYTRGHVVGGPRQTAVNGAILCPANSLAALNCSFDYNVVAMRAAFDF